MDLSHIPCEEAAPQSRDAYIPCGRPSEKFVYHSKDRRVYAMCNECSWHNIKNRGGIELVPA